MFSFKKIFKYLWIIIKPYKTGFFLLFLLIIGRILFSLILIPYVYKSIIDLLGNNSVPINQRYDIAIQFLIVMSIGYIASISVNRYRELTTFRFISRITKDAYDFSFKKIIRHSYSFYTDNFSGSLVAKIKRFIRAFEVINSAILSFWFITILIISSTVMLYFQSKKLALYLIVWCFVYLATMIFFVKKKIKLDLQESEADSRVTGVLADSFTNILNIKMFSGFIKENKNFQSVTSYVKEKMLSAFRLTNKRSISQGILMIIFQIFILYTMLNLWKIGEITIGVFILTYLYIFTITDRIWDLSDNITNFMKAMTDVKEVVDIFDTEIEVKDPENAEESKIHDGMIEFKNVSFKYNKDTDVLNNFNFKINKGEKIGLVGHSGSGKSTITKILLRFLDVDSGEILIDGQNIANIKQDKLRESISYVPQDSILFHRSIKENISYSVDNTTDDEIIKAAKMAYANDFIVQFSNGYDTLVGERGIKLSGGERQRIAIARAMLKKAPILILDEATSSLDSISEQYIQEAFNELMKGKTTIVIAHRLSTIQKMDRIIVLENGKIVEEGTHKELIEKDGNYADLWNHQVGGFIE